MNRTYRKRNRPQTKPKFQPKGPMIVKKRRVFRPVQQSLTQRTNLSEIKCIDTFFSAGTWTALVATGTVAYATSFLSGFTLVNGVSQGNAVSQRIGNKVVSKMLRLKADITCADVSGPENHGPVRCMLVLDNATTATPLITDIIADIKYDGTSSTGFNSGANIVNTRRFKILRDQIINMSQYSQGAANIDWIVKEPITTIYNTTASPPVIANITSGAVYFLAFLAQDAFVNVPLISNIDCRMRYYD